MMDDLDDTIDERITRHKDVRATKTLLALLYTYHPDGDSNAKAAPQPLVKWVPSPDFIVQTRAAPSRRFAKITRQSEVKRFPDGMPIARRILKTVAEEFGISVLDLTGQRRSRVFADARFAAVRLFLEATPFSFTAIGVHLGGRDHTTILHARDRANDVYAPEALRNRLDQLKSMVTQ